jgi:hypothetical protein
MAEMTPGAALRELRQAHAGLKTARQLMKQARTNPRMVPAVFDAGWDGLVKAHRVMSAIPRTAVDEAVMTQQLSVQRYSTALLVRLRRIQRQEGLAGGDDLDDLDDEDGDDLT